MEPRPLCPGALDLLGGTGPQVPASASVAELGSACLCSILLILYMVQVLSPSKNFPENSSWCREKLGVGEGLAPLLQAPWAFVLTSGRWHLGSDCDLLWDRQREACLPCGCWNQTIFNFPLWRSFHPHRPHWAGISSCWAGLGWPPARNLCVGGSPL